MLSFQNERLSDELARYRREYSKIKHKLQAASRALDVSAYIVLNPRRVFFSFEGPDDEA